MAKRYLIGQLGRFGDCLFATTIAHQIKFESANNIVIWAIHSRFKETLNLNPHIDEIIVIDESQGTYNENDWVAFKKLANKKLKNGEIDEVIYSQIPPDNMNRLTSTIRRAILKGYPKPIFVDFSPQLVLSNKEVQNVKNFVKSNNLDNYKNLILFECAPSSKQTNIDFDDFLFIAENIVKNNNNTGIILSSPFSLPTGSANIFDGSKLSFRENAELTHYCTLLLGCSSGITWISTSSWAKKLPMIQLLSQNSPFFCGVAYDFKLNGIDTKNVIELLDADRDKIISCIQSSMINGFEEAKDKYNQIYKPNLSNFNVILKDYASRKRSFNSLFNSFKNFESENDIKASLFYKFIIMNILYSKALVMQNLYKYFRKGQEKW